MAVLNLPKSELIKKLEARKTEIIAEYKEAEDSVNEELERRKDAISDAVAQADWYEELAAGLRDGRFDLTDSGKVRATKRGDTVPAKPGTKASSVQTMRGIRGANPKFEHYDDERLRENLVTWVGWLAEELKPIDNAIALLNLATDDVIEVNSDDYSSLLNGGDRYSRRRYLI